ncbi:MAG: nicotinate-nucleotide diphosphorylase (carboxylating), partial [Chitinophagaceae bacterium]|nr:nicotinate-nucleotide diphosphorylase (carboxylating) [Chitinophagaceae bacterium]
MELITFIEQALIEDIGNGDHSTLACIPASEQGKAILKVKENGILAGVEIAATIFKLLDPDSQLIIYIQDGTAVHSGDIAFEVNASVHVILKAERLVLNIMQRMSGIA